MLPRSRRLLTEQINEVMEKGKTAHSRLFLLRWTNGNSDTRISAIIPKKIGKTAVVRGTGRRVIYNSLRPLLPAVIAGSHVVLFSKTILKKTDAAEVSKDIRDIFVKTSLLV